MGFFDVLAAFVPLVIVIAMLYGVLILIRKYGHNLRGKEISSINIKILSTKMIMAKKYVTVIKVEDKVLVLGVSDHSINLLKELETDAEPENSKNELLKYDDMNSGTGESFLNIMKKNFGMK